MQLAEIIRTAKKIAIAGHVRPDGDCVGAALGLYNYIVENDKEAEVHVYLEQPSKKLSYLANFEKIENEVKDTGFDLFLAVDLADKERMGIAGELFEQTANTACIDHHISNMGYANVNYVRPEIGSVCEVIFDMLEEEKISVNTAEALYTGIVHDTGVFKHTNTTRKTMETAGALLEKGIHSEDIIDRTFYKKSYVQNQILGRALMESIVLLHGKVIFSIILKRDFDFY